MAMVLMLNGSAHENGKVVLSKYNDRDTSRMQ